MKLGTLDIEKAYFGTLELTEANTFIGEVPVIEVNMSNDEIWYTSTDGELVYPSHFLDYEILSNTYVDGKGIIKLDKALTSVAQQMFDSCYTLESIMLPDSVTNIKSEAFSRCVELTSISYAGTVVQWGNISKENRWEPPTSLTVVHCKDGDASI